MKKAVKGKRRLLRPRRPTRDERILALEAAVQDLARRQANTTENIADLQTTLVRFVRAESPEAREQLVKEIAASVRAFQAHRDAAILAAVERA